MTGQLRISAVGEKEEIKEVVLKAIDILSQDRLVHKGIGLKRLKGDFWEIRKGLKARILFRWQGDLTVSLNKEISIQAPILNCL